MTTDIKAWVKEHSAIHAAATKGPWERVGGYIENIPLGPSSTIVEVPVPDIVENCDIADLDAIVDAHNTLPAALSAIEAVLELHSELIIYELDDVNGVWKYDEDDERVVLARICRGCSSDEAVEHVGDNEWSDTWDDGSVEYPCATRQALEGVIDGEST